MKSMLAWFVLLLLLLLWRLGAFEMVTNDESPLKNSRASNVRHFSSVDLTTTGRTWPDPGRPAESSRNRRYWTGLDRIEPCPAAGHTGKLLGRRSRRRRVAAVCLLCSWKGNLDVSQ